MPPLQGGSTFDGIARKWCDLAQRRLDYFIELYRSGRWAHYYSEADFSARMRDVIAAAKIWAALAQRPRPESHLQNQAQNQAQTPDHLRPAA
jgi:uncharacterized repeat protein (TIGR03809 family)